MTSFKAYSATDVETVYQDYFLKAQGICIDNRKLKKGEIFWALGQKDRQGHHRGNAFAEKAVLEQGAQAAVINDAVLKSQHADDPRFVLVEEGLQFLQALARRHRQQFRGRVFAIAGSNGKTTTKELLHRMLAQRYNVWATPGNLNNHIGLPLSILNIRQQPDWLIFELGANHVGETAFLAEIAQPQAGLVTNCGKDHLGEYGSFEQVVQANSELYDYLAKTGGQAFVPQTDALLEERSASVPQRVLYGGDAALRLQVEQSAPLSLSLEVKGRHWPIETRFYGSFWAPNILAAAAVALEAEVPPAAIASAVESYQPANLRSEWRDWQSRRLLLDCYNANPSSMERLVQEAAQEKEPPALILGEMLELGSYSAEEHRQLLEQIQAAGLQEVYLLGAAFAEWKADFPHFLYIEDIKTLRNTLQEKPPTADLILVKGSRGARLEQAFEEKMD